MRKIKYFISQFHAVSPITIGLCVILIGFLASNFLYAKEERDHSLYDPYQGTWTIKSVYLDQTAVNFMPNATGIEVSGKTFKFLNPTGEFLEANRLGGLPILIDQNKPERVTVFWFQGLVKLEGPILELVLKYNGQGVEGEAANDWMHPKDFKKKAKQDHFHVILKKVI